MVPISELNTNLTDTQKLSGKKIFLEGRPRLEPKTSENYKDSYKSKILLWLLKDRFLSY